MVEARSEGVPHGHRGFGELRGTVSVKQPVSGLDR